MKVVVLRDQMACQIHLDIRGDDGAILQRISIADNLTAYEGLHAMKEGLADILDMITDPKIQAAHPAPPPVADAPPTPPQAGPAIPTDAGAPTPVGFTALDAPIAPPTRASKAPPRS